MLKRLLTVLASAWRGAPATLGNYPDTEITLHCPSCGFTERRDVAPLASAYGRDATVQDVRADLRRRCMSLHGRDACAIGLLEAEVPALYR